MCNQLMRECSVVIMNHDNRPILILGQSQMFLCFALFLQMQEGGISEFIRKDHSFFGSNHFTKLFWKWWMVLPQRNYWLVIIFKNFLASNENLNPGYSCFILILCQSLDQFDFFYSNLLFILVNVNLFLLLDSNYSFLLVRILQADHWLMTR